MKKMYIYPQTDLMDRVEMTANLMDPLLGSGSGPEPAPERQASGGDFLPL